MSKTGAYSDDEEFKESVLKLVNKDIDISELSYRGIVTISHIQREDFDKNLKIAERDLNEHKGFHQKHDERLDLVSSQLKTLDEQQKKLLLESAKMYNKVEKALSQFRTTETAETPGLSTFADKDKEQTAIDSADYNELREINDRFLENLVQVQEALKAKEEECVKHASTIEELREKLSKKLGERVVDPVDYDEMGALNDKFLADILKYQATLKELEKECVKVRTQLLEAQEDLKASEDERDNHRSAAKELNVEVIKYQDSLQESEKECARLRGQLLEAQNDLRDSEQTRKKNESEIEVLRADIVAWLKGFDIERQKMTDQRDVVKLQLDKERRANRKMLETIEKMHGNIRVMVRIRPLLEVDTGEMQDFGPQVAGEIASGWSIFAIPENQQSATGAIRQRIRDQEVERIFGPDDTNATVFDEVEYNVRSGLEGGEVTIFAYGASGTGKTFTFLHQESEEEPDANDGLVPRAIDLAFQHAEEVKNRWTYSFEISAVEIYLDELFDLLSEHAPPSNKFTHQGNETIVKLESYSHAMEMVAIALKKRRLASTKANDRSSRSHLIFRLRALRSSSDGTHGSSTGVINLIDLAGCEKVSDTASEKEKKESHSINASLTDLITMIGQMGDGGVPTPSKTLGKFIKSSFGKNGRALMMTTISPMKEDYIKFSKPTLDKAEIAHQSRSRKVQRPRRISAAAANALSINAGPGTPGTGGRTPVTVISPRRLPAAGGTPTPMRPKPSGSTGISRLPAPNSRGGR
ncbi:putative Kinesin motor domain-containing protein [Seiridium unicorne]|uniref:Kinesin motor domain-containing protein n=1 Tax=Seiridium unicorne TaxID=138068 RepID=A0ABR2V6Y1_9PEZI